MNCVIVFLINVNDRLKTVGQIRIGISTSDTIADIEKYAEKARAKFLDDNNHLAGILLNHQIKITIW